MIAATEKKHSRTQAAGEFLTKIHNLFSINKNNVQRIMLLLLLLLAELLLLFLMAKLHCCCWSLNSCIGSP
jgi:hypothetical protein